jgi:hypothetical protein
MAIDTRDKRASAVGVGLAVLSLLPTANSAVSAADRLFFSWLYAGIAAAAPSGEHILSAVVAIRQTATANIAIRQTASAEVEI